VNILMIAENDPAGMGIAFTNAINTYTEHSCRLVTTTTKYNFDFEKDLHVPDLVTQITTDSTDSADSDGFEEIEQLLRDAEIIHFHMLADDNISFGSIKVKDYLPGKAILHHHHGHPDFRSNPEKYRQKYRRLKREVLVSTPDLLQFMPGATWQPNLVPIDSPSYLPFQGRENGKVRICQSPTRKDLKNTEEFKTVISSLKKKYGNLEGVIIENTQHENCLRAKQKCDIHFDHMQGYYGVSSLESLSQGKPVIAGLDQWNIKCIKEFTGSDTLPWVIAGDQDDLKKKLEHLIEDIQLRDQIGARSRHFMKQSWTEQRALNVLCSVYQGV